MELTGLVEARILSVDNIEEVASRRGKFDNSRFIDLMGQWEFAKQFGLEIDLTNRPGSEGRINFVTDIGTIGISTFQKPYNLLREVGKECAKYHVLARFQSKRLGYKNYDYKVELVGWESDEEMLQCPTRSFGYGIVNHYKHVKDLRPMIELRSLLLGEAVQVKLL